MIDRQLGRKSWSHPAGPFNCRPFVPRVRLSVLQRLAGDQSLPCKWKADSSACCIASSVVVDQPTRSSDMGMVGHWHVHAGAVGGSLLQALLISLRRCLLMARAFWSTTSTSGRAPALLGGERRSYGRLDLNGGRNLSGPFPPPTNASEENLVDP